MTDIKPEQKAPAVFPQPAPQFVPLASVSQPAPAPVPTSAPVSASARAEERLAVGEEYEKTITQLMEMGFPREQVVKAMKAAFNNPERATEFLLNVSLVI
jgi:UV excision repair protein RAD23